MPTAQELKAYLAKRGIPVLATFVSEGYALLFATDRDLERAAELLSTVQEPGPFTLQTLAPRPRWWEFWKR